MNELNAELDGNGLKIGLVAARFNHIIVEQLLDGTRSRLLGLGVSEENITLGWVAGAFEVPLAAKEMARKLSLDAVSCLGCVIRGDTPHFDYVAGQSAHGVLQVGLETGIPMIYGILTTENIEQAVERASVHAENKGSEFADSAVEMVQLLRDINNRE
ncbi:MAG: 6,7-dimethyl-8-ribityllumazine synthase [Actinomycetota bacterium]|nr:6,7-dimethyl-8-ribityllumazine synthase [Actinomycetota bacterium]